MRTTTENNQKASKRQKTYFKSSELAHVWVHEGAPKGRCRDGINSRLVRIATASVGNCRCGIMRTEKRTDGHGYAFGRGITALGDAWRFEEETGLGNAPSEQEPYCDFCKDAIGDEIQKDVDHLRAKLKAVEAQRDELLAAC